MDMNSGDNEQSGGAAGAGGSSSGVRNEAKFKSVRRAFKIVELVNERGGKLTAKQLAHELDVNLSSCYYLINILVDEGYIEKIPRCGGYRLGSAISELKRGYSESNFDARLEPILEELSQRSRRQTYSAIFMDGDVLVTQVKSPSASLPVGVNEGFRGAAHALALGKVLIAGRGVAGIREYIQNYELVAFTPRTITQPGMLEVHLNKVRTLRLATDFEEFAKNLCCVAAPVYTGEGECAEVTIGVSTTARHIHSELQTLVELVQRASEEASAVLMSQHSKRLSPPENRP